MFSAVETLVVPQSSFIMCMHHTLSCSSHSSSCFLWATFATNHQPPDDTARVAACCSSSVLRSICWMNKNYFSAVFRMKEHFFLLNPIFVASSRDRGWRTIRSNTNIEPCWGLSLHNRKKMKRKLKLCQRQHANYHLFMHLAQHFPVSCQTCRYRFVQSLHCGLISLTKEPFHHADTVTGNMLNSSVFSSHEHPKTIDHNQVSANSPWKNMLL